MYNKVRQYLKEFLYKKNPWVLNLIVKYKREIKYAISGGTAALAALLTVFIATDVLNFFYLISVVLGQVSGFFVNFYLQKFWTFRDPSKKRTERQFKIFIFLSVMHTVLNAIFILILVEIFDIWYLYAQAIIIASLAILSYFFNRFVTFKGAEIVYEDINDKL